MSTVITNPATDVVVLGLGFSGPSVATELATNGYSVVGIEKGPYWDFNAADAVGQTKYDEWGCAGMQKFDNPYGIHTYTWRNNGNQMALPGRRGLGQNTSGHGVGGMAWHFNGQAGRYSPWVYERQSMTASRYGSGWLNSINQYQDEQDWPYTYAEIEEYYTKFEGVWGVAGENMSALVPMSGNFPLPPHPYSQIGTAYGAALEALGYNPYPCVSFHASAPYVNTYGVSVNECAYDGWCVNYVCETGAKGNGATRCIPAAIKSGNFTMELNSYVFRINVNETTGLATGVSYYDAAGNVHIQPATVVVNALCQSLVNRMFNLSGLGEQYNPTTVTGSMGRAPSGTSASGTGSIKGNLPFTFNEYPYGNSFGGSYTNLDFADDNFDHSTATVPFIGGTFTPFSPGTYPANNFSNISGTAYGSGINSMGSTYKASLKNKYLLNPYSFSFGPNAPALRDTRWNIDLDPHYTDKYNDPLARLTIDNDVTNGYGASVWFTTGPGANIYPNLLTKMGGTDIVVTKATAPSTAHVTGLGAHLRAGCSVGSSPSWSALNMWNQLWGTPNVFAIGEITNTNGNNTTTGGSHPFGATMYAAAEGVKQYLASPGSLVTAPV